MTRDELIEAMVRAARETGGVLDGADAILDVVEPVIRADERAKPCMDARILRGLRAKVEALRTENSGAAKSGNRLDQDFNLGKVYAYERVLNLIDGGGDE
jgi:hypothetical protein